mmetsp:Transcript_29485/g.33885  ORF Transcript_29485/g.33885 Transcript_29485/m.33885 type:complete len:177 (-) Transcript_29485:159-689(-)
MDSINFVWNAKKNREWQDKDRTRKIEKVKDLWQKYFDELVKYKESHGNTLVPKVYQKNQALSSWVFRQRKHFRLREQGQGHSMTDQRLNQLEEIDFQFRVRGPRGPNKKKSALQSTDIDAMEVEENQNTSDSDYVQENNHVTLPEEQEKPSNDSSINNHHVHVPVYLSPECTSTLT